MLELVHGEDLPRVGSVLSEVVESPGTSPDVVGARLLGASGDWMAAEFTILKVLEAPGDTGLVVADVRAAWTPREGGSPAEGQG